MRGNEIEARLRVLFSDMCDFFIRELTFGKKHLYVAYLTGYSSRIFINEYILQPICRAMEGDRLPRPIESVIINAKIESISEMDAVKKAILAGDAVVFGDYMENGIAISVTTKNEDGRSPVEPDTENVIRGAHEGFTESGENNAMLIRRRLKTEKLKRRLFPVGTLSSVNVSVMYLEGVADARLVEEVIRRIKDIQTDTILDSGDVEIWIQDGKLPLYPTVGNSERPDKVAAKLLEGRVAILVDGSPVVLTAPYLFLEAFQVSEDYAKSSWYATFIRSLRFFAYLIALYFPALLVALFVRHTALLPEKLISLITDARETLPFSVFWEVLVIFLIFESVREVGLRMPKAVGSAIGFVGSLLLGDSAIKAGIASAPVLIVVALAAICNFIVPPYMNANSLYRFLMIVISGALGLYGFFGGMMLSAILLCGKNSFGVPYLSPIAPIDVAGLGDFLVMIPVFSMRRLPRAITGRRIPRSRGKVWNEKGEPR